MTELARGYSSCRYGQIHYLRGQPRVMTGPLLPCLVMLHQTPSSCFEYAPLVRELARDRDVVAFDTPGYGMSDAPPAPPSLQDYAHAFADAIERMELNANARIDVFGYHTGALLAVELGVLRPDLVGKLVLSGIPMRTPCECAERLAQARATPGLTSDGVTILAQHAALWRYVVTERAAGMTLDRAARLYIEKCRPLDRFWWAYEGVWSYDFGTRLKLITQPTLVLQPRDALFTQSRAACALIDRGHFVELSELSRDIFDVGIAQIAAHIRQFIDNDMFEEIGA